MQEPSSYPPGVTGSEPEINGEDESRLTEPVTLCARTWDGLFVRLRELPEGAAARVELAIEEYVLSGGLKGSEPVTVRFTPEEREILGRIFEQVGLTPA